MHLSISAAASYLGVSISTMRRWDASGVLTPAYFTPGGHRRYCAINLKKFVGTEDSNVDDIDKPVVLYGRVSSRDQLHDLKRQIARLKDYAEGKGYVNLEIIEDLGSGLKYDKPGLSKLLRKILNREISKLVIHHKDRLLRFGSELIFTTCKYMNIEVEVIEDTLTQGNFEQELAGDVLEIITVFSSKLYGRRSHLNRKKESYKKAA